jgi:hypothetical protein
MNRDEEGACDQPGDPKKVEKRREQNRLAKKRSRAKQKQDQVRNEGKAGEEKEQEVGYVGSTERHHQRTEDGHSRTERGDSRTG